MDKTLKQLYLEHQGKISDKWTLYLDEWDRAFEKYRYRPIRLLEIGVQNGGSLEVWATFFEKAEKLVGCDIDPKCKELQYNQERITVMIGDVNSDECEKRILLEAAAFDIIIDDGSHRSSDIIRSFARYFPHLNDDGVYLVEDLHSSYWAYFEGGLNNPFSAMSFFKRLTDIINHEHWRNNKPRGMLLEKFEAEFGIQFNELDLMQIHSIEFVNSLCLIRKSSVHKNTLGNRITAGTQELVTSGGEKLDGTTIQDIQIDIQEDSNLDVFELITQTRSLAQALADREQFIADIQSSMGWKLIQAIRGLTYKLALTDSILRKFLPWKKG